MDPGDAASAADIRRVVESWAIFRDSGDFKRLAGLWHDDARMMTTWAQVSATEFIDLSRQAFERGVKVSHFLGGFHCDIVGDRAIAQTRMAINQRSTIDGAPCDAVCEGRFYDFFERREGEWKISLRQPIYERDRLDPVAPGAVLVLDQDLLDAFPEGYRHLAYMQTKLGMVVKKDMPGVSGPATDALYERGAAWLRGEDQPSLLAL